MKEKLKKIYNHFGEEAQMHKLIEEAGELAEAVREGDKEHITEEIADVLVLVDQITVEHDIQVVNIFKVFEQKADRTIERIATRYYESEDTDCMAKWKADNNVDVVNIKTSVKAGNIKFYVEEGCIICASCNNSDRVTVGKAITKKLPYECLSPLARLGIDELNRREESEENEVAEHSDRRAGTSLQQDK